MRILYLSQYFPPEAGATQTRAYEMSSALVQAGHQVTMLAEFPNHPSGIIPSAYRGKRYERVSLEGIDVLRVSVRASPEKNFRSRMLFYLSYMFSAILAGIFLARQPYDLILATSPPLFAGAAGLVLSYLRRLPLVFEVRDLWPAAAVALGELRNPIAIRLSTMLEEACYRRAVRIIVVTRGMQEALEQRGVEPGKLVLIPNGANTDLFGYDPAARQVLRRELGLEKRYVAMYAGIFGIAQGLETILQAAQALRDDPNIFFILVGDGPQRAGLIRLAEDMQLDNLLILPELPRERIPAYLSAADVALIPLRKIPLFQMAVPSKLFDAWACERPVICAVEGEAQQVVHTAGGGVNIPAEDAQALAEMLLELKRDVQIYVEMGIRGRAYTCANYSRQALAQRLIQTLQTVFESSAR
jgi:colanic acid biosynthesis glycosyl transferase WcaI